MSKIKKKTYPSQPSEAGKKEDKGKPDLSLVPYSLRIAASRAFLFGTQKYARDNWRTGFEWHRLYNALNRHLEAWWQGEDYDPESGLNHLDHAAATLAMLIEHVEKEYPGDTRYKGGSDYND